MTGVEQVYYKKIFKMGLIILQMLDFKICLWLVYYEKTGGCFHDGYKLAISFN